MRTAIVLILLAPALLSLTPPGVAQEAVEPQRDWMVHMDRSSGEWRFVPDRIVLLPGGTVQLMVFGAGEFSLVLDDGSAEADITAPGGPVRTAQFPAPTSPGEYRFHDKHHPEATGVLVVAERGGGAVAIAQAAPQAPVIGVIPGGYEARFAPDRLEVEPGAKVTFRANGTFGHELHAVDGSFEAGALDAGEESNFTAPMTPGEYPFECAFHKDLGMVGVLIVREASVAAPGEPPESATPEENARDTPGLGAFAVALAALAAALILRKR